MILDPIQRCHRHGLPIAPTCRACAAGARAGASYDRAHKIPPHRPCRKADKAPVARPRTDIALCSSCGLLVEHLEQPARCGACGRSGLCLDCWGDCECNAEVRA